MKSIYLLVGGIVIALYGVVLLMIALTNSLINRFKNSRPKMRYNLKDKDEDIGIINKAFHPLHSSTSSSSSTNESFNEIKEIHSASNPYLQDEKEDNLKGFSDSFIDPYAIVSTRHYFGEENISNDQGAASGLDDEVPRGHHIYANMELTQYEEVSNLKWNAQKDKVLQELKHMEKVDREEHYVDLKNILQEEPYQSLVSSEPYRTTNLYEDDDENKQHYANLKNTAEDPWQTFQ